MPKLRILPRGDDLGSFHSANLAILDAHRNGFLLNASIMACAPFFDEAAEMVESEETLCLGLHASFTCEWLNNRFGPVTTANAVPSFIEPSGCFKPNSQALKQQGVSFKEMMVELQGQLDLARSRGLNVEYVDEHMGIGDVQEELTGERFEEVMARWAQKEGLVWHGVWEAEFGQVQTMAGRTRSEHFRGLVRGAEPRICLFMTHPAFDTDEIRGDNLRNFETPPPPGFVAEERAGDHEVLTDPEVMSFLESEGVGSQNSIPGRNVVLTS